MASGPLHMPAVTSPPVQAPPEKRAVPQRKYSDASIVGMIITVTIGGIAFALAIAAIVIYKNATVEVHVERTAEYMWSWYECNTPKSASYIEWLSIFIAFVSAATASVFGGCPCCCSIRSYTKGLSFYFSIIFLILTWLSFALTLIFRTRDMGTNIYDHDCEGMFPEQIVSTFFIGIFGAAHIAFGQLSWMNRVEPAMVGLPISFPV